MAWMGSKLQIDEPKVQYFASEFEPQPFPLWDFGFQYQYKKCAKRINLITHGLRTPRQSFFSEIRNFWAWADKLGRNFMRHLGYFWPNYKHYFGTVSPLSMGKCSWFSFLQKTLVFRSKTYNSQILPK